jgi:hypothetical protein
MLEGDKRKDTEGKGPTAHREDYSQESGEKITSLCVRFDIGGT